MNAYRRRPEDAIHNQSGAELHDFAGGHHVIRHVIRMVMIRKDNRLFRARTSLRSPGFYGPLEQVEAQVTTNRLN